MKYSELHRKLKGKGCYETERDIGGYPRMVQPDNEPDVQDGQTPKGRGSNWHSC